MKEYKLSEIAIIENGGTPSTEIDEYWNGDISWITPYDLSKNNSKWITYGERNITKIGINKSNAKLIPARSIMVSTRAPIGYIVMNKIVATTNQGMKSVIPNNELVNTEYLYYLLKTKVKEMNMKAGGTTFKEISTNVFKGLKVNLPSIEEQNLIGYQLSLIDEKIDSNNTLISYFNEYSQLLFYKWFIDFNFPNKDGNPYKSSGGKFVEVDGISIPYGWSFEQLGKYLSFEKGISYKSNEIDKFEVGIPMLNLNSFKRTGGYKPEGIKFYKGKYNDNKILKPFDLVVACTDVTRNADIIGSPVIVPDIHGEKLLASCDVAKVNIKEPLNQYYLSCVLKQKAYQKYIKGFANGTNVLHLDVKGISKYCTYIPNNNVLDKFADLLKIFELKKSVLIKENKSLEQIRDLLINKLIK